MVSIGCGRDLWIDLVCRGTLLPKLQVCPSDAAFNTVNSIGITRNLKQLCGSLTQDEVAGNPYKASLYFDDPSSR